MIITSFFLTIHFFGSAFSGLANIVLKNTPAKASA